MTAILNVHSMTEHVASGRHPWDIGTEAMWRQCPVCGHLHHSGIRLCGPCCYKMYRWAATIEFIRSMEIRGMDMEEVRA